MTLNQTQERNKIIVSIEEVKGWMAEGVTRYPSDSQYDENLGSVQEKYGLTPTEAKLLFKDQRLAGIRVQAPSRFVIAEDQVSKEIREEDTRSVELPSTPAPIAEEELAMNLTDAAEAGLVGDHRYESLVDEPETTEEF